MTTTFDPTTNAQIILDRLRDWRKQHPEHSVDDELNQIQAELHTVTRSDPQAVTPYYLAVLQALIEWGKVNELVTEGEALFIAAQE